MAKKTVLVAGASGLVGYAAMQHFAAEPDCQVIALSRRKPDVTFGARFIAADLTDRRQAASIIGALTDVTHVIFSALYERPSLVDGWRDPEQIRINDEMLRNLLDPLTAASPDLAHVSLLQGTKAYGVHVRPMQVPARENRSEARDIPNFYWNQEDYLRDKQRGKSWCFSIFRPVLILGFSLGSAMNLIPALGTYAAILKAQGRKLDYPGGPPRPAQAIDADMLARAMAWAGEAPNARNETFNVANGDIFVWHNVWPALADAFGMQPGTAVPMRLATEMPAQEAAWAAIRARHGLVAPDLTSFVGLSFQYADFQMGHGRTEPAAPAFSSTIKLAQAGFHEVMDSEVMFTKWIRQFQDSQLLPPA